MKVPSVTEAKALINEAEKMNIGAWVAHSKVAANCAESIAEHCNDLDETHAYVLGLLHDIGRREGVTDLRHTVDGYNFMLAKGYDDCARICLTHSFPLKDINSYNGQNDCSREEFIFIRNFIENVEYDDYDKLIQLCDALSYPDAPVIIEKRLVDVAFRRGINELTIPKWHTFLALKEYFDHKIGEDIYKLLEVKLL